MKDNKYIKGGATVWARQTTDSEIFYKKPDKWFKIWFFLVNRVNHKKNREWERGECYIKTGEIESVTGATPDTVKKCMGYLRGKNMILTKRSTRGFSVTVIKYNVYQDFASYVGTREALEKHQRSTTINKNVKNVKKQLSETSSLNNKKNMSFNKQSDDYEEGVIDIDGDSSLAVVEKKSTRKYPNAPAIRKLFQETLGKNPANWRQHKPQLLSSENLYTERGLDKVKSALEFYVENKDKEFCPQINSPYDLDGKWTKLGEFKLKQH